jgi:hypothetical protein
MVGPAKLGELSALAVDATDVYLLEKKYNNIHRVPLAGGTVVNVAAGNALTHMAIDDTHVYWLEEDKIMRVAKDGSPKEILAEGIGLGTGGIALEGDLVYALVGDPAELVSLPKTGGTPQELATAPAKGNSLLVFDGHAYATAGYNGYVLRSSLSEPAFVELIELTFPCDNGDPSCPSIALTAGNLAAGGDRVFVATNNPSGSLYSVEADSGTVRTFAPMQRSPRALAANTTHVYWGWDDSCGRIFKAPVGGGAPSIIASLEGPTALAVTDDALYVGTSGGQLFKVAK